MDFTPSAFDGQADSAFRIALNGRVDFTWHVGTETDPSTVATWEGSSTDDSDGAVAIPVNTIGHVAWVSYRVDILTPAGLSVLRDQAYAASFTWS